MNLLCFRIVLIIFCFGHCLACILFLWLFSSCVDRFGGRQIHASVDDGSINHAQIRDYDADAARLEQFGAELEAEWDWPKLNLDILCNILIARIRQSEHGSAVLPFSILMQGWMTDHHIYFQANFGCQYVFWKFWYLL